MLLCFWAGSLQGATPEWDFVAMEVPVYMEAEGKGPLYEVHLEVVSFLEHRFNATIKTHVVPPVRADQMYRAGQVRAFVPDFCDVSPPVTSVKSIPFAQIKRYIFTPPDRPAITALSGLNGLKLGLVRGYHYALPQSLTAQKVMAVNQRNALRMLNGHRVDAIIASPAEIAEIAQSDGLAMPTFAVDHPLIDKALCYSFADDMMGRLLAVAASEKLLELRANGFLKRKLGSAHIEWPAVVESPSHSAEVNSK